jgi:hypothetical protein
MTFDNTNGIDRIQAMANANLVILNSFQGTVILWAVPVANQVRLGK